jgi:hypothetical protein
VIFTPGAMVEAIFSKQTNPIVQRYHANRFGRAGQVLARGLRIFVAKITEISPELAQVYFSSLFSISN